MKIIENMKMYDNGEVSALLGVNVATLAAYRRKGALRSVRIGRNIYTSEESIKDFLNGKTQPQNEDK